MAVCSTAAASCWASPRLGRAGSRGTRSLQARAALLHTEKAKESAADDATSAEELEANEQGRRLRAWVEDAGGYIHPALRLSLKTSFRCRGVVAAEPIPLHEAAQHPLVAIPESLLMTADAAQQRLGPALARRQQQAARRRPWWQLLPPLAEQQRRQLDPTLLLALLLASERRKGAASFWAPYIAALPEEVPCGWALAPDQLTAALGALGPQAAAWRAPVEAAAASVAQRCEAAAAAYGQELDGLEAEELRWALGQVVSRCFGAGADLALLPWIDLHNHRQHAGAPQGFATAAGQACAAIYSRQQGEAWAVAAGDEVCITYVAGASTEHGALQAFLNFGFVPDEFRR